MPVITGNPGSAASTAYVDLYWLPLGAGGHVVRLNGRVFEAVDAVLHRRRPCDLYHSALEVRLGDDRYVIEQGWRGGVIPDVTEAVASPQRLSCDTARASRLLARVHQIPRATWGRDEQRVGEMWNSNSLVSWLLARSGHDTLATRPPPQGRAPGWGAGLSVAARGPKPVRAGSNGAVAAD